MQSSLDHGMQPCPDVAVPLIDGEGVEKSEIEIESVRNAVIPLRPVEVPEEGFGPDIGVEEEVEELGWSCCGSDEGFQFGPVLLDDEISGIDRIEIFGNPWFGGRRRYWRVKEKEEGDFVGGTSRIEVTEKGVGGREAKHVSLIILYFYRVK